MAILSTSPACSTAADPALLEQRYQEVVKMPQLERDRLQRNLSDFEKMSEAQQEHYRNLQRQLDENKASGGPLTSLLQTYSAWLQTLTPGQREELQRETDSAKKMALVRKFKEEQYRPADSVEPELPDFVPDGLPGRFFGGPPLLPAHDLRALMKVLAAALPESERGPLDQADKAEQYREILRLSLKFSPDGPRGWPSPELQERLMKAIESNTHQDLLKKRPEAQREILIRFLFFGVMNQAAEEAKAKWPHRSDLDKMFRELDRDKKQELLQHSPREMNEELVRRFFEKRNDDTHRTLLELKDELALEMSRLGLLQRPPPESGPGFGPFRGGPGDRMGPGRNGDRPPPRPRDDRPKANGKSKD